MSGFRIDPNSTAFIIGEGCGAVLGCASMLAVIVILFGLSIYALLF